MMVLAVRVGAIMAREIERKYLVENDAWRREAPPGVPIVQGYLSADPDRSVRIRIAGDDAFVTIKGKAQGSARDEYEYPIPKDDAAEILENLCLKPPIEKTRYIVRRGDLKWEIDEFAGENRGLVMAEVETAKPSAEIEKPAWLGKDVTADPRYANVRLARHPFSQWERT